MTSGTIIKKYLECHGIKDIDIKINRGKAHGLTNANIDDWDYYDLIIIVDSLDNDYHRYKTLKEKGSQIVILDHHEFTDYPEDAVLVSSAKDYSNPYLSGAGVCWKFCAHIDLLLKTLYAGDLIDLCACGILADVSDISENSHENRYLVSYGLQNLKNLGIQAIIGDYQFNSQSVLWSIAPLINAANRTSNNELAIKLFNTDNTRELKKIVKQLKEIKEEQDQEVSQEFEKIESQIDINSDSKVILGTISNHEFSGLLATKIANKFQKPCIVLADTENESGLIKGSMRSYGIKNLRKIINDTDLCKAYGHPEAAGIYVERKNINLFISALNKKLANMKSAGNLLNIDLNLDIAEVTPELIKDIEKINKLSGKNFNPVSVLIENVVVSDPVCMQDKHTKFKFCHVEFIKWNDNKLYEDILCQNGFVATMDVIGQLQQNVFAGKKSYQLIISEVVNLNVLPEYLLEV